MEANKIIITGGATRIGAAIAEKLSGPGKEIVIHFNKSSSKAEKLKKELSKNNTTVYLVKGDLSVEKDVKKILKFAKSKLKYFDCLINNASLFENDKLDNFTTDSWGKHLRTNLRTPALLSKAFAKHIKALNKKMKESATNLEFEEAAKIRDEIRKLESTELEVTLNPKVKQYSLNNKIYPKGRSTMGMPGTRAQKGKKKWKQIKS